MFIRTFSTDGNSPRARILAWLLAFVVFASIIVSVVFGLPSWNRSYQAVFLSNGQVYFGKITHRGWRSVTLKEVYYFQIKGPAASSTQSDDFSLIKLGNELHGPEDKVEIIWSNVVMVESLRTDSRVVKAIQSYKLR